MCGDDTYLIVENLRRFLREPRVACPTALGKPLFMGRRFKRNNNTRDLFNTGGPGYVVNKLALKVLGQRLSAGCGQNDHGWHEDVIVSECFRRDGVLPMDTRDEYGRELFHPFLPENHLVSNMQWNLKHVRD